jgi:hypothetical protein
MLWREVQTGLVPCWGGGVAGSSNRWGILMPGVVVRVRVRSDGGGGGWQVEYCG